MVLSILQSDLLHRRQTLYQRAIATAYAIAIRNLYTLLVVNTRQRVFCFHQCCGSVGSVCFGASWIRIRNFYHQSQIVMKIFLPSVLWLLFDFLSLNYDVNVPSKSNKQKNTFFKLVFLLASWRSLTKIAGSRSGSGFRFMSQMYGSSDPVRIHPKCRGSATLVSMAKSKK